MSYSKREKGGTGERGNEEDVDEDALWDQWVEWVHEEKSRDYLMGEIEPPSAEIDLNRIKRWIQECRTHHGETCNNRFSAALAQHCGDLVFVDVIDGCIVDLPNATNFVALSYVWGDTPMPKLRRSNYNSLKQPGQLFGQHIDGIQVPQVIQDAIYLVRSMDERYLWVDSLCVMQDASAEDIEKTLQAMARIYASAEFTIVAAGGSGADHGLRGIGGPSKSRIPDNRMYQAHKIKHRDEFPWDSIWASRGWTFQESTFARRLLIFDNVISWMCDRSQWREELLQSFGRPRKWNRVRKRPETPMGIMTMITPYPSLQRWGNLVEKYSSRAFTHENDFVRAFAGATNVFDPTFPGGFVHGLPRFFLDIALLWYPANELSRRSEGPSWSWTGWKGKVECSQASILFDPGRSHESDFWTSWELLASLKPIATYQEEYLNGTQPLGATTLNDFYNYQALRNLPNEKLPDGWERIEHPQSVYFTHPKTGGHHFKCAYPVPQAVDSNGSMIARADTPSSYLVCTAPIATLSIGVEGLYQRFELLLENAYVGDLIVHNIYEVCMRHTLEHSSCELIAISEVEVHNAASADFVLNPRHFAYELPDGCSYYNVLWIHWENGIAYRKGIGAVNKDAWDSLGAEVRTFKLG
jgi:hypothetical protein